MGYAPNLNPHHAAVMPNMMLKEMYSIAIKNFPCCASCKFSAAKAEKVVKPPQTPVAKNNL